MGACLATPWQGPSQQEPSQPPIRWSSHLASEPLPPAGRALRPSLAVPAAPPVARVPRSLGLALVVIAAAQLMIVLDATIVNVALPHIQRALTFSGSGLEWVVTAY